MFQCLSAAGLLGASLVLSSAISGGAQDSTSLPGFSPARFAAERALEQKFQSLPDPAHAESNLRQLTSTPHLAGTEASHRVALWLLDQYRSYGFDAEIVSFNAWMPFPREVKLELVAPAQKSLATPEEPFAGDPDTYDQRITAAYNAYSPSGEVTAPVVYVNYGTPEDYRTLDSFGVSVEGKIALARYGRNYRGIKTKLAEEHKALGLVIFSDPEDDGFDVGEPYPRGPWRPMSGIQRGSVLYTQIYPGDPLTPGVPATPDAKRLEPADAANLPRIPTMPINAQDASVILTSLGGKRAPSGWQGGLPLTYHIGPGPAQVHMKISMDYAERPVYDVIAKLHGTSDDEWVVLGNHHDAWVFGAADPGSGTAGMLETARSLGELVRSGWKPRRTIVMCAWDAEEQGLIGSTEWVEANRAELQAKAVAYINTDVGVTGPNFAAAATPSLQNLVRDVARDVSDPNSGLSVYAVWRENFARSLDARQQKPSLMAGAAPSGEVPLGALGAGSDFCPFLDFAGIPSVDLGFTGEYGVYHSLYDDFFWMKHFGDPAFTYHAALARILGMLALRLDEADILPLDFASYASEIARAQTGLVPTAVKQPEDSAALKAVSEASADLSVSAARASQALQAVSYATLDAASERQINRALAGFDQALLSPEGLAGRPWYKHTIFAPGSYAGYDAEWFPGVTESLGHNDPAQLRQESDSLAAALHRAAARLEEVARLAQQSSASPAGHR